MGKIYFLVLVTLSLCFIACSPSVESQAEEAARLNKESLKYVMENDLEKAEELFKESDAIVQKYKSSKDTAEYNEFFSKYLLYLNQNKELD